MLVYAADDSLRSCISQYYPTLFVDRNSLINILDSAFGRCGYFITENNNNNYIIVRSSRG